MSKNKNLETLLSDFYNIPWDSKNMISIEQCKCNCTQLKAPAKTNSHLWQLDLNTFNHIPFFEVLSVDEKEKLHKIIVPLEKQRRAKSRILLRLILANYLEINPSEVIIKYDENGKPIVKNISFNISHAANYLVILIGSYRSVGVDIETELRTKKVINSLAQRFFSMQEFDAIKNFRGEAQSILFNRIWTLKEAVLKSTGKGILFINEAPDFSFLISKKLDLKIQFYKTNNYKGFTFYNDKFCISAATEN